MIKRSKKAESSNMEILIILIVGLVALALLLSIIFRADLLNFLRNLPDFGSPNEDRVIELGDDKTVNNIANCEEVGALLTIERKGFLDASGYFLKDLFSEPAQYGIAIAGSETKLFVYQYSDSLKIELDEKSNEEIGQLVNQKILIDNQWIDNLDLRTQHPDLPSSEALKSIDDGYLNGLKICKKLESK